MKKLWKITIVLVVVFTSLFLPGVSKAQNEVTICPGFPSPYQGAIIDSSGKARIHLIAPSFFEDDLPSLEKYYNVQSYDEFEDKEMYEIYARLKRQINIKNGILVTYIKNTTEDIGGTLCTVDVFWNDEDGCVVYANAEPIPPIYYYKNDELHTLESEGVISWDGSGFTSKNGERIYYNADDQSFVGPPPSSLQGR